MKEGETPCAKADLDGDGQDDYAVRLFLQDVPAYWFGTVTIFSAASSYEPVFRLADAFQGQLVDSSFPLPAEPSIFGAEDFNGDGRPELAVTSHGCGAHTCHIRLYLVGFGNGGYELLIRKTLEAPHGVVSAPVADNQIRFQDVDGDGLRDLVFRQGLIASFGAGPQRGATRTYRWDGERYTFASIDYDPSDLRYFKVRDADDAFARRDYEVAIRLYREAIDNRELREVQYFGDPVELVVYAQFRIGLSLAALGQKEAALEALDVAITSHLTSLHGQVAESFRRAYATEGSTVAGCTSARELISGNLRAFQTAWFYGYANPPGDFDPDFPLEALCPF